MAPNGHPCATTCVPIGGGIGVVVVVVGGGGKEVL